jgi:hypothetical protein
MPAPRVSFRLSVVAYNIDWPTLYRKVVDIRNFFVPVCDLQITIEKTSLTPAFAVYPDISPLPIMDRDWYEKNISGPRALTADITLLIVAPGDHSGVVTTSGAMVRPNFGPWEGTIFAAGEDDRVYVAGKDVGDYFTLYACHELSHAFYGMLGKRDDTHVHFPNSPQAAPLFPDDPNPEHALNDLDFSAVRQSFVLNQLKQMLLQAAAALSLLQKQRIETIVDTPAQTAQNAPGATKPAGPDTSLIKRFCLAIQAYEGWTPGSRSFRNNNPGNLRTWYTQIGTDGGFAVFKTYEDGFAALMEIVENAAKGLSAVYKPTMTIKDFFNTYAPSSDNNHPDAYALFVAKQTGVSVETPISALLG